MTNTLKTALIQQAKSDDLEKNFPKIVYDLYGNVMKAVKKRARYLSRHGVPAEDVAKVVLHAFTASKPKIRYLVGKNSWVVAMMAKWIPDWFRDKMVIDRVHRSR